MEDACKLSARKVSCARACRTEDRGLATHTRYIDSTFSTADIAIYRRTQVTMTRSPVFAFLLYLFAGYTADAGKAVTSTFCTLDVSQSLYNFNTTYLNGTEVSLNKYRGHVSLVLNVATYWGYAQQYPSLNALMKEFSIGGKYKCGFSVLAFPCNQFNYQEPGANSREILNGLRYVRPGNGFEPNFPLFQKTQVNGANEDQIYTFLKVIRVISWCLEWPCIFSLF